MISQILTFAHGSRAVGPGNVWIGGEAPRGDIKVRVTAVVAGICQCGIGKVLVI